MKASLSFEHLNASFRYFASQLDHGRRLWFRTPNGWASRIPTKAEIDEIRNRALKK